MRNHTREFVSRCIHCKTLTPPNAPHPHGEMPTPPRIFHTWGIDIVGPFPRDTFGKQYLLKCIDHLTGWAEAIPLASKKTHTVQEAFLNNIVARYGIPEMLVSDNGGEFTSDDFEQWLRECGTQHRRTSPYNPQSNGMIERFNGTIQKLLLRLTGGNERHWSKYLSEALYACRISEGPFGLSPYQAVFGTRPRLPRASNSRDEGDRLKAIHLATKILVELREEARRKYKSNEPRAAKTFAPGTLVSIRVLAPRKGQAKWQSGYQVLSNYQGGLRLLELSTGKELRINQRNVREIPAPKSYDEIDPPKKPTNKNSNFLIPTCAIPVPPPDRVSTPHVPQAAQINNLNPYAKEFIPGLHYKINNRTCDWQDWLLCVAKHMR